MTAVADTSKDPSIKTNSLSASELDRLSLLQGEKYADEWRVGTYKCAQCNNVLYRSEDKFRSRGRWPAFRKAATPESIKLKDDYSFGLQRKEIVCGKCGSHIGHLFADGKSAGDTHPDAKDRHCVLSLTMNFEADPNAPTVTPPPPVPEEPIPPDDEDFEDEEEIDLKKKHSLSSASPSTKKEAKKTPKKARKSKKNSAEGANEEESGSNWLSYVIPVAVLTAAGVIAFVAYKFLQKKKDKK
jgi:peptide methionine sulfoxide reductase MsrB